MAEHQLTCAHCGAQFTTSHRRKYCTKQCAACAKNEQKKAVRRAKPKRGTWSRATAQTCACIVCNNEFMPKAADRTKCCSRECGWRLMRMVASVTRNGGRVFVTVVRKRCHVCRNGHGNRASYCSDECKAAHVRASSRTYDEAKHQVEVMSCRECNAGFVPEYGNKHRAFCPDACGKRSGRRVGKAKRDSRIKTGAERESVDPNKVFARDGWKCQLCGRKVVMAKRGTIDARAPELDHIVPLSLGGSHTYANTQCSCRRCNGAKGATVKGQMNLFPRG